MSHDQSGHFKWSREQAQNSNAIDRFLRGANSLVVLVVSVAELMCFFKPTDCPTLQNKPKLFFIQTCRGALSDRNLTASGTVPPSSQATVTGAQTSYLSALSRSTCPEEVDFLLAFSTAPGYISVRGNRRGSPFIQVTGLDQ